MGDDWLGQGLDDVEVPASVEETESLLDELEERGSQLSLSAQAFLQSCQEQFETKGKLTRAQLDVLRDIKNEKHDTPAGW